MPLSVDEFCARLEKAKLLSVDEAKSLAWSTPRGEPPQDGESLAAVLVASGKLTAFQVKRICGNKAESLVLGSYVLLDELGQGGMGAVYRAEHRQMKRQVALKIIRQDLVSSPSAVRRFQREVQTVARLDHPNIVTAFDAGESNGTSFLAMQLIDGKNLSAIVREKGPLNMDQAVDCVLQAARGLEYAHGQGIIHRDVKPSNLLLDPKGTVKILDLGLATLAHKEGGRGETITGSEMIVGTVDYMAPEQAEDSKLATERSDIYSLGMTLWFLLTGRIAYDEESEVDKLIAHREREIPSLSSIHGQLPKSLDNIFQRMVAKRPADRYPSMTAVISALETFQRTSQNRPGSTDFGATAKTVTWMPTPELDAALHSRSSLLLRGGKPTRAAIIIGALVIAIVPAAVWWMRSKPTERQPSPSFASTAATANSRQLPLEKSSPGTASSSSTAENDSPNTAPPPVIQEPLAKPSETAIIATSRPRTKSELRKDIRGVHREIAETVIKLGGKVSVDTATAYLTLTSESQIPLEPFCIAGIFVRNQREINDGVLNVVRELSCLPQVELSGTSIGDDTISNLQGVDGIAALMLDGTSISDKSTPLLGFHHGLSYLSLARTGLSASVCREIRKLPRLRHANLAGLPIDDAALKELSGHPTLADLNLYQVKGVTAPGLTHLESLPYLDSLNLDATQIDDDAIEVLSRFKNLKSLGIPNTKISADGAKRLQAALSETVIRHPSLELQDAYPDIIRWVLENKGTVVRHDGTSVAEPPDRPLLVGTIAFPDKGGPTGEAERLSSLRNLRALVWPNLVDTDAQVKHLKRLSSLRQLDLRKSDLTDQGMKDIVALKQLDSLDLERVITFSDKGLGELTALGHLRTLRLDKTQVTDQGLEAVSRLSNLTVLSLVDCRSLTSEGLRHLTALPYLRTLIITGNVDNRALSYLKDVKSLRLLKVRRTNVTSDAVEEFHRTIPQCTVFWDGGAVFGTAN